MHRRSVVERFFELPFWWKAAIVVGLVLLIDATIAAFGERRLVAGIAEEFVARLLYWAMPIASIAAGIWAGLFTKRRTGKEWVGWIVGVLVASGLLVALGLATLDIPGVSWRLGRMMK